MPQVEITREQIIVVDHSETDTYGKLIVTDKAGTKHTINAKHSQLAEFIIPGRAVKFQYGNYMNKEFISNAILVETPPPQPMPTKYPDKPQESVQSKSSRPELPNKGIVPDSRNRGIALSYAKDVLVAKIAAGLVKDITKIEVEKMKHLADECLDYMENIPNLVIVAKEHGAKEVNKEEGEK